MAVHFFNADINYKIKKPALLKKFIAGQFKAHTKKELSLSCIFCSDEYLLGINKQFLQHDFYTDIITFPLDENKKTYSAEIYISIDRVSENAVNNKATTENELHRVLFHGVLHLCGYGDKTKAEKAKMTEMENLWLSRFQDFKG